MLRLGKFTAVVMMVNLASLSVTSQVMAIPLLPSSFYGTVKVNGGNVPDGTLVRALIDGQVYAEAYTQSYQGNSVYALDITGDNADTAQKEGGRDNDTVQFEIGGSLAEQTGTWKSGTNVNMDLTASVTTPINTPQVTPTAIATQTTINTQQPMATSTISKKSSQIATSTYKSTSTNSPLTEPIQIPTSANQPALTISPLTQTSQIPTSTNQSISTITSLSQLSQSLRGNDQPTPILTTLVSTFTNPNSSINFEEDSSSEKQVTTFGIITILVIGMIIWIVTRGRKTLLKSDDKSNLNYIDKEE